jgi:hypothetical protein
MRQEMPQKKVKIIGYNEGEFQAHVQVDVALVAKSW